MIRKLFAGSIAAALALMLIPGFAAAEDTEVSFTITGDGLQLTQAANSTTLGGGGGVTLDFGEDMTVSGTLPQTTVTDARGELDAAWDVQVGAVDPFTNVDGDSVALSNAHVYLDATDLTDLTTNVLDGALTGMTVADAELTAGTNTLASAYSLINGTTSDLGLGEAPNIVYTPTIDVMVPAGTPVGTYTTTVTQTVS